MNDTPAAPAPEPVAWAVMPIIGNGPAMNATHRKAEADSWREHGGNVVPLYAHPAPVAAPDADAIMALADAAIGHAVRVAYGERPCNASESRAALRAAVERLKDEADQHGRDADEQARLRQRAEAEAEALRIIVCKTAEQIGAALSPSCTLAFMALLPEEAKARIERAERARDEALALLRDLRPHYQIGPDKIAARIDALTQRP